MKKLCLVIVGLYISMFSGFGQSKDTSQYKQRKLAVEEVNLIGSYYHQDGDNSAVTGGIGTEKLTDYSTSLDIKLTKYSKRNLKHTINLDAGIDYYTSASSDKIDLIANSSASSADIRIYPSVAWQVNNEVKGITFGLNTSFSKEFDYTSVGVGASFFKKINKKSGELGIKVQAYFDKVKLVLPVELRVSGGGGREDDDDYGQSSRNSYSTSLSYSQIVNQRLQLMFLVDVVKQDGFLSLPFHRVYFADSSLKTELLPSSRFKVPVGVRASYFLGDKIILRAFYRYYHDDWGLSSNTADIETSFKITPFVSVTPFYRYYTQTAVKYFAPYRQHIATEGYYTSNYDLSKFNSHFVGTGVRLAPPKGVLGMQHFSMFEIRYGHYTRSNSLQSDIVTVNLMFK